MRSDTPRHGTALLTVTGIVLGLLGLGIGGLGGWLLVLGGSPYYLVAGLAIARATRSRSRPGA